MRRVSPHSISEIQRRAASGESLVDVPVFSAEWPECKARVVSLLAGIEDATLPLLAYSVQAHAGSLESEEALSVGQARDRLAFLRGIALEQDRQAQLEEGFISSPEEYVPLPESEA